MPLNAPSAPRTPPSRVTLVLGGLVVLLMLGVAVLFYRAFGEGQGVQYGLRAYEVRSDTSVVVSFDVAKDEGRTAECTVQALDRTQAVVGSADVRIGPSSGRTTTVRQELTTTARAVAGQIAGCTLLPAG